jgi:Holliday junction resolvasome RuvABC endonuclease subunit
MILGLDISTSITGVSIIDRNSELIYCEAWRTDTKDLSFYQKLDIIKDKICFIKTQYPIEMVCVEEPLGRFAAGRSSAQIISKIQRFNGVVCWILREVFDMSPQYINASTARKTCGIKIKRGEKAKEVVLEFILKNEKKFKAEYTKKGNPVKGVYDKADSLVIAKAGYYLNKRGEQA